MCERCWGDCVGDVGMSVWPQNLVRCLFISIYCCQCGGGVAHSERCWYCVCVMVVVCMRDGGDVYACGCRGVCMRVVALEDSVCFYVRALIVSRPHSVMSAEHTVCFSQISLLVTGHTFQTK